MFNLFLASSKLDHSIVNPQRVSPKCINPRGVNPAWSQDEDFIDDDVTPRVFSSSTNVRPHAMCFSISAYSVVVGMLSFLAVPNGRCWEYGPIANFRVAPNQSLKMICNPSDKINRLVPTYSVSLYKRRRNADHDEMLNLHIFIQISGNIWKKVKSRN